MKELVIDHVYLIIEFAKLILRYQRYWLKIFTLRRGLFCRVIFRDKFLPKYIEKIDDVGSDNV